MKTCQEFKVLTTVKAEQHRRSIHTLSENEKQNVKNQLNAHAVSKSMLLPLDMLNNRQRYQSGLTLVDLYPPIKGTCACGCATPLTKRKVKWASEHCRTTAFELFAVIKGDVRVIRELLYRRDNGFCQLCGVYDENWEADHIIPVHSGGAGKGLENFQTLCLDCHKIKTAKEYPTLQRSPHRKL